MYWLEARVYTARMAKKLLLAPILVLFMVLAACGGDDAAPTPTPTSRIPVLPTATLDTSPTSTVAPTRTPLPEYLVRFGLGQRLYRDGRVQEAIQQYNESIRLNPDFDEVYNDRGAAFMTIRQFEQAIEDFNEAIRRDPTAGGFYANRAMAYTLAGNEEAAQQDINKAVELGIDRDELLGFIESLKERQ